MDLIMDVMGQDECGDSTTVCDFYNAVSVELVTVEEKHKSLLRTLDLCLSMENWVDMKPVPKPTNPGLPVKFHCRTRMVLQTESSNWVVGFIPLNLDYCVADNMLKEQRWKEIAASHMEVQIIQNLLPSRPPPEPQNSTPHAGEWMIPS